MATPSKKAGDESPITSRARAHFNPLHTPQPFNPLHTPRPYALLRGASREASGPVIVPGEPVLFRFTNET